MDNSNHQTTAQRANLMDVLERYCPDGEYENVEVIIVRSNIHNGLTIHLPATGGINTIDVDDLEQ